MIWAALQEAVHRVEGVASKGRGDFPFMVIFVDILVDQFVV